MNGEKLVNGIIFLAFFILLSTGLTLIIISLASPVSNFVDQFFLYYTTQGFVISLLGYKLTKKYNNNKETLKNLLFWRNN